MDISELPTRMQFRKAQFRRGANSIVQAAIGAAGKTAVETTPVDTGVARSNWIATVGTPFEGTIPAYSPYPKYSGPKLGETANAAPAIEQIEQAADLFDINIHSTAYLQNNVPYIGKLNDGTQSDQSSNMVELGAQSAIEKVRTFGPIFVG